jgi:hypothetical protein
MSLPTASLRRSGAACERRPTTVWPPRLLRGALLLASEDIRRVDDGPLHADCLRALAIIDEFATVSTLEEVEDAPPAERAEPRDILIVTAPECESADVLRQVFAALVAGNRVALFHHSSLGTVARIALAAVERHAPAGVFLQFEDEPLSLPWAKIAIVIMTPTRVFLNDEPAQARERFDE